MFEPANDMNERVATGYNSLADGNLSDNLKKNDLSNINNP